MAKETKKNAETTTAPVVSTVENIREQLDAASLGRKELADAALEKIKKDHDEHTQREMSQRFEEASYQVERGILNLRRERDIASVTQSELIQRDRLSRFLMGYEVTEALIKTANPSHRPIVVIEGKEICSEKDIFTTTINGKETPREEFNVKDKTVAVVVSGEVKTFKVGDNVPPIIDYVDYDELKEKIKTTTRKAMSAIDDVHNKYSKKLDAKYNNYWCPSWRW